MPTYNFVNTETGEEYEEFFTSFSAKDTFLAENPHIKQLPSSFGIGDPIRMGQQKPSDGFRDILRNIKKKHRGSTVNTW